MQLGTLQYSSVLGFPIHSTMAASMLRHIELTARAGHDLKDSDWSGKTDPYLILELEGQRVETEAYHDGGENPVWDQTFKFVLPAERPGEHPPILRVTVMNSNRLLPDRAIGHGHIALDSLLQGGGTTEVQVPIKSKAGIGGGWVLLAVRVALGDQTYQGSAAGSMLGTVHVPAGAVVENALPPASQRTLHESQASEPKPVPAGAEHATLTGAPAVGQGAGVGVGQAKNPAQASFGTML